MPANDVAEPICGLEPTSAARRGLLRWLPALALTGASDLVAPGAARKRKKKAPLCGRCPKLCETQHVVLCTPRTDTERCACAWTTSGKPVCVNTITLFDPGKCKSTNECVRDADCGTGEACILVDDQHCCPAGKAGNLCFPICSV
jgi:hypothetical protein